MANMNDSTLPDDFLREPATNILVSRINFTSSGLPEYDGLYAIILDHVLTPEECNTLVKVAEQSTAQGWTPAPVNIPGGKQMFLKEARNCSRILWDSRDVVDAIWNRCVHVPEVQEILCLQDVPRITGPESAKLGEVWKFSRPNDSMRFLKYSAEEYFRRHEDGGYETPKRDERAYVTLHLYLNNASVFTPKEMTSMSAVELEKHQAPLVGGATSFHGVGDNWNNKVDVLPKAGRILLFQHRKLTHSGADVLQGVKYTMRADLLYTLASSNSECRSRMPTLGDEDLSSDSDESSDSA